MKNLIAIALLAMSATACAGAQTKINHVQAQVNCYIDLVEPYADYLTEEQIKSVLDGMDFSEIIAAAQFTKAEVDAVKAGIKVCKNLK
jgi:hypothetical protein